MTEFTIFPCYFVFKITENPHGSIKYLGERTQSHVVNGRILVYKLPNIKKNLFETISYKFPIKNIVPK